MILYITDNPEIKKTLSGDSFLLYQLFDWRIIPKESETKEDIFDLKRKFKLGKFRNELKVNETVIAIVAPSNYKLIYDLLYIKDTFNKNITFYSWDSWSTRKKLKINEKEIKKDFNEYLQRGYFTKLIFKELSYFNLQRVEQLVFILGVNSVNKILKCGNLGFNSQPIIPIENNFNTVGILRILISTGYTLRKAIDKLIYHSRKNDITDPFLYNFKFLNESNSLYKKIIDKIDTNIYLGQNDSNEQTNPCSFTSLIELTKGFIPLTDILKTLRFLEKNDLIRSDFSGKGFLKTDIDFSVEDLKLYFNYLSSKTWNQAYKTNSFAFGSLFPKIDIVELKYSCPLCGSSELKSSPKHFFCSDLNCLLYVNRIINPGGIKKQVTENEFIRLINHGSALIRNKIGGYNRFLLERTENTVKIKPQIESNKIEVED